MNLSDVTPDNNDLEARILAWSSEDCTRVRVEGDTVSFYYQDRGEWSTSMHKTAFWQDFMDKHYPVR